MKRGMLWLLIGLSRLKTCKRQWFSSQLLTLQDTPLESEHILI